jgi:hypothetical protein
VGGPEKECMWDGRIKGGGNFSFVPSAIMRGFNDMIREDTSCQSYNID